MKMKAIYALVTVIFTLLTVGIARAQTNTNHFQALVLAERGDQHEPFVAAALAWLKTTAARENFTIDVYANPDKITKSFLTNYQVIIQLNYPPYRWSDEAKAAFVDYIEQGRGGWVGLHHATLLGEFDGYAMWPWFSDFMGGIRFKNYIAKRAAGEVILENTNHPAFQGLPPHFVIQQEEWYTYDHSPRPKVTVLAHVDESTYVPDSDIKMGDHPVIWTNEKMKARNIYFQMGHHPSLLADENFKLMLRNAIVWAADRQ
jgi:type 1 glutamine amidotransferase